jgi:hypothetical protein
MDIRAGEVVVFDKAYVDFSHLHTLTQRDVFWVTRAKDNLAYEIVGQQTLPSGPVLLSALVRLTVDKSRGDYPELMTYVLLRFVAFKSRWTHSFSRLFTVLRAVLWNRLDMYSVLDFCGTASDPPPLRARPSQAYLPGFAP